MSSQNLGKYYVDERDVRAEPEGGFWRPHIPNETVKEEILSIRPKIDANSHPDHRGDKVDEADILSATAEKQIKDLKDRLARSELNSATAFSQGREVRVIDAQEGAIITRLLEPQVPSIGAHARLTSKTQVIASSSGSKAPLVRSEEDLEVANLGSQLASCKAKAIATQDSLEKALAESQASRERVQQDLAELKKEGAREAERLRQQFAADIRERERAHRKATISLNEMTNQ